MISLLAEGDLLVGAMVVSAMVAVGGAAVLFQRLSGQGEQGWSAFTTGAGNVLAFWTASSFIDIFDETVGMGTVTIFALAGQLVAMAWTQRFRERRIYRAALTADDATDSLDPTAT